MSKDVKESVITWTAGNMAGLIFLESVTYTRLDFNSESFPQLRGILNSGTGPLTFAAHFPIIPFIRRNPEAPSSFGRGATEEVEEATGRSSNGVSELVQSTLMPLDVTPG